MRRARRIALRCGLLVGGCVAAMLVLELGVRVLAPQQLIQLRPDVWIADDEGLGWRQREGIATTINTGEGAVRLVTGEHGHRLAPERHASEPSIRVLALGDSFTVGLQVEYADLFTARLEALLTRDVGRTVAVSNTGVGGWGPSHYLLEARRELAQSHYDAVVVALFAGNDVERARVDHFPPKQAHVVHALRLPRDLTRQELIGAVAYPLNDVLERHSHAFMLAREVLWRQLMRLGLSARRLPDALLRSEAESTRWAITADLVAEIVAVADEHGTASVVCLIPGAYQVDPELAAAYAQAIGLSPADLDPDQPGRLLGKELAEREVSMLDLLPTMRRAASIDGAPLYGVVDTHLSPRGHAVVAAALEAPLLDALHAPRKAPS